MFVVVDEFDRVTGKCYYTMMDSGSLEGLPASGVSTVPVFLDGYYYDENGVVQGEEFETRITFPTIYPRERIHTTSHLTLQSIESN